MYQEEQQEQRNMAMKIGRLRMSMSATRMFSGSGKSGSRGTGGKKNLPVLLSGSYRYRSGLKAKSDTKGRFQSHVKYLNGERVDQIKKGVDEKRQLYSDTGDKLSSKDAVSKHADAFLEHRVVLSLSGEGNKHTDHDLHVLSQATIQEVRSRHPEAEITASYAIHRDTDHPHSHLLITSPNRLVIGKQEYREVRQDMIDMRSELEQGREQNLSQNQEQTQQKEQLQEQGQELSI